MENPDEKEAVATPNLSTFININQENKPRTAAEMLAEASAGENIGARKLTFREQCGAFSALYGGVRNQVVARAFGISVQCASLISGCLEYDPDPHRYDRDGDLVLRDHNRNRKPNRHRHYEDVAREFELLGKEEFDRRYYTERVHNRIILAKEELRLEGKKR
jgi:hypothetical protein